MSPTLRILACIAFALAALGVAVTNVPLIPLGLFLWCLSSVVS